MREPILWINSATSSDLHTFADEIIFSLRVNNFIATGVEFHKQTHTRVSDLHVRQSECEHRFFLRDPGDMDANPAIMFSFPKLPSAKDARNRRRHRQCRERTQNENRGPAGYVATASANDRAYRAYRVSIRAWRGRRAIMIITGIRGAQLGQRSDRNALEHASRRDAAARRFSLSSSLFFLFFFFGYKN